MARRDANQSSPASYGVAALIDERKPRVNPVLTEQEKTAAECLFQEAGYVGPLRIARLLGDDERVFVVESDVLARLPVATLTAELPKALGRKVWITAGPAWTDTEPLR